MKRLSIRFFCAALAALSVFSLTACNNGEESKTKETAAATTAPSTEIPTAATTTAASDLPYTDTLDMSKVFTVKNTTDQPFAGTWQITDGVGSELEHFAYCFDGDGKAYLMVGTMGFVGTYSDNYQNTGVFLCQLMYGINGTYTYQFADDKKSVVLTDTENQKTTTLTKTDAFNPVPKAKDGYETDSALFGAWADGNGGYLYFDKSGVMLDYQKDFSFTFYAYSAKDGNIEQTYAMTEETTETAAYKVEGDTLTYNKLEYKKVSANEILS